ncbi:nuclear pore complex component [Ophiostoma piceae UAMH 11346]|uniref:Nuclear pore complex component n=1 Tax=Ophiostoma piceae (strain UAMH 11346) TaxID=1262450 RepID=S3BYX7_OPHP1|nr:nuclear pore complex component [Ophiostoma piceae UAMH 11346]
MSYQLHTPQRQTARPMTLVGGAAKGTPSKAPSTPIATDSPGNWRHPRMEEITRRRATSVFTETNLKTLVYNGLAMFLCFLVSYSSGTPFKQLRQIVYSVIPPQYGSLVALILNTVFAINIVRSVLPLFRKTDNLVDIPLTPSQRKLLGLDPLRAVATPNAVYTTPPRYARTPSVSGSAVSIATATRGSASASGNDSSLNKSFSGSPISNSPLFPKARAGSGSGSPFSPNGAFQNGRKSSFGSPSANGGASLFGDSTMSALPGTPSPTSGKRLSMGLNNKWLYEKGRRSSSGTRIY